MDDRRFDDLAKAFAKGANRRSLLKGMLGIGGAVVTGGVLRPAETGAARRPTPTPIPPKCPGRQTPCGSGCCCPAGQSKCGPDCCNDTNYPSPDVRHSECCDNACCFGTCYGEELCCATNDRAGGLPPTNRVCDTVDGPECCAYSDECCLIDGCCATVCFGGAVDADRCCPSGDFCAGGSTSDGLCCMGDTPIKCGCGTNSNTCIAADDAACCVDADCDTPPSGSSPCVVGTCEANVCVYTDCSAGTEVCCPDGGGVSACRTGDECCLSNQDCADTCEACVDFACVDDPVTFPCGPENDPDKFCCPESNYSLCCGGSQFQCCGVDRATGVTRECDADGACCPTETPYYCADSEVCCAHACVVTGGLELCCDEDEIGCNGACCAGTCLTDQSPEICCMTGLVCPIDNGPDECCPNAFDFICCGADGCVDPDNDDNNCGACGQVCSGCSTCQSGVCVENDDECESDEVCCPREGSFICETGPNCGCDIDADCAGLSNPAACKVGYCDAGECKTAAAPDTTICRAAGESPICFPAAMCNGEDQSCPGSNLAPVGTDCGDCAKCNGLGTCSSTCTGDEPQCCVNNWGEFCIPEGETCCGGPDDCPGDCDYCNDEVWYCINRCGGDTPTCCPSAQGDYCLPVDGVCCDSDDDCPGECEVCSDYPGACISACSGAEICCTEAGTEECCTADRCVPGEGCCNSEIACAQCCGDGEKCCYNSYCIAEEQTCCQGPVQCNPLNYCTNDPVWHSFSCPPQLGYCVETTQVCNGGNVCLNYDCARDTGCRQIGTNPGASCGTCMACSSAGVCDVSLGSPCGDECCGAGETCCGNSHCIPTGQTCCVSDADCPSFCNGLIWNSRSCGADGYCVGTTENCFDGDPCTNDSCSASGGCSHTPVVCPDVVCLINVGCGYDGNPACTYGLVTCGTSCGGGNQCDGNGNCVASPVCR